MDEAGVVGPPSRSEDRASDAVVWAVAGRAGVDPTTLPPLYDTVEPDSLDRLVATGDESGLLVTFEYAGYVVRVTGPRDVTVSAADD